MSRIFRINHTRFHFLVEAHQVKFIQFGRAPEGSHEINEIIAAACQLYDTNIGEYDSYSDVSEEIDAHGDVKKIICHKGMSGCRDFRFVSIWHEYVDGVGFIRRQSTRDILHISMADKLNSGITVDGRNRGLIEIALKHLSDGMHPMDFSLDIIPVEPVKGAMVPIGCQYVEISPDKDCLIFQGRVFYPGHAIPDNFASWTDTIREAIEPHGFTVERKGPENHLSIDGAAWYLELMSGPGPASEESDEACPEVEIIRREKPQPPKTVEA